MKNERKQKGKKKRIVNSSVKAQLPGGGGGGEGKRERGGKGIVSRNIVCNIHEQRYPG